MTLLRSGRPTSMPGMVAGQRDEETDVVTLRRPIATGQN
jgi:hypothetical protein